MAEYICREDALGAFGLSEKTRKYGGDHSGYDTRMLYEIQDTIESIEPADVVQVVRCRDCKHLGTFRGKFYCRHNCGVVEPKEDDFCSRGESKE